MGKVVDIREDSNIDELVTNVSTFIEYFGTLEVNAKNSFADLYYIHKALESWKQKNTSLSIQDVHRFDKLNLHVEKIMHEFNLITK